MSHLHIMLISADSCKKAAHKAQAYKGIISERPYRIGGVVSEDNSEQLESYNTETNYPLSWFQINELLGHGPFDAILGYVNQHYADPLRLPHHHPEDGQIRDISQLMTYIGEMLPTLTESKEDSFTFFTLMANIRYLQEVSDARDYALAHPGKQPEFFSEDYDQFGLTDFTQRSSGRQRYAVLLDIGD